MPSATEYPCPSFEFALSQANYTLKLPNYRSSHLGRYHPYGKRQPKGGFEDLMETVDDDRSWNYDNFSSPRFPLSVVLEENEDVASLHVVVPAMEGRRADIARRIGPVELIIDFALAMRRQFEKTRARNCCLVSSAQK
ncbi:hypothetical protein SERLA73DRAFT_174427 [Serpula lacrymans var. lacrymans S7.3]|uniref:Uncharacterized protein n=2 Tax=Serpula lacrymans var. lacrymans TaxID=341189 RepID=F8PFN4_SERL3|nr:uncharacterized protein SERLADRAFT_455937 [Serpula lacrymans var. lacrymans S7.9]EGO05323.1 hypothetical protein SERLA73DRAFT_174427 [Serpula lacrymans var. lacrymans S7.3]EGO31176.1 hypothetical protein SERLADRAFT_455937 [Serpula lacrymans var. lacrymans S7.9]